MTVYFDLETIVGVSPHEAFGASLDIDAHIASMEASGEQAIGGVIRGTIGLGETVTWRAKHFGITWKMTSKITELEAPHRFVDEQLRGPFKLFRHEHLFQQHPSGTKMIDLITFDAPFGPLGDIAEKLILGAYLSKLIRERNEYLRAELEGT